MNDVLEPPEKLPYGLRLPVGTRFGKLTILEYLEGFPTRCRCRCDCGNERTVTLRALKAKDVKSCGCLHKPDWLIAPVGSVFRKLTVLEHLPGSPAKCKCRCACGTEITVLLKSLKRGNTKSCGCLRTDREKERKVNLIQIGTRYGRLVVVESRPGKCLCQCDCGKTKEISGILLNSGRVNSCGCLRRELLKKRSEKPIEAGTKFNQLTVLEWRGKYSQCRCDCGKEITVLSTHLRTGHTQSCGCYQAQIAGSDQAKEVPIGDRFGKLVIINNFRVPGKGTWCNCQCDCGKIVSVRASKLREGNTKSCGCLLVENAKKMAQNRRLPDGVSAFNSVLAQYKAQATMRGLNFDLSTAEFRSITESNCDYCDAPPAQVKKLKSGSFTYNGIDRLDNTKGYSRENIVTACMQCNGAKRKQTLAHFKEWITRLSAFTGSTEIQTIKSEETPPNAAGRHLLNRYIQSCRHRGISFNLPESLFFSLVKQPCAYCGALPAQTVNYSNKTFIYNGIDRINSSKGYLADNCASACFDCNNAKGTLSAAEFKAWAARVAERVSTLKV